MAAPGPWHVFSQPTSPAPNWLVQGGGEQPQHFWVAVLAELGPLYDRVGALPGPWLDNLRQRVGIEAHPTQAALLGTVCLCPTNFKGVLDAYSARFKFKKLGKTGRGPNSDYFKLRPAGLIVLDVQGPLQTLALSASTFVRGRLASALGTCGGALGARMFWVIMYTRGRGQLTMTPGPSCCSLCEIHVPRLLSWNKEGD